MDNGNRSDRARGWLNGLIGVAIFSASLPATRIAVTGFSPLFLTSARAVLAALLGWALLVLLGERRPARSDLPSLAIVSAGAVLGFPLLTALALQHMTSAHSIVFIGLLPLSTAIFGTLRGGDRPKPAFWFFSIVGAGAVAGFALRASDDSSLFGDLSMSLAIVVCGLGYAEGGRLARRLGGWQVISWALLLAAPVMLPLALATRPSHWTTISLPTWLGLAYVSIFSALVGFIFWYRGLALGGIARVGQIQLLQPFMGLALAALVLGEPVPWSMFAVAAMVIACVFGAKRFG